MNEFWSMLVPLQTLPGWPNVEDPSLLQVLGLLVGAPLLVIALIAVFTRVHHAVKGNAGVPTVGNQPIWVNGRRIEPSTQGEGSQQAIDDGYESVGSGTRGDGDAAARDEARGENARGETARGDNVGGAGARW